MFDGAHCTIGKIGQQNLGIANQPMQKKPSLFSTAIACCVRRVHRTCIWPAGYNAVVRKIVLSLYCSECDSDCNKCVHSMCEARLCKFATDPSVGMQTDRRSASA